MDVPVLAIEDEELAQAIEQVVKSIVSDQDVVVCGLIEESDEDGNAQLVVDLCYAPSDVPIRTSNSAKLIFEVRNLLSARGDKRFPHIYHNLPEGQPVEPAC